MRERDKRPTGASAAGAASGHVGRPFVGVFFQCCRKYARAYLDSRGCFSARCPRCLASLSVPAPTRSR